MKFPKNEMRFEINVEPRFQFRRNHVQVKCESTAGIKYCYIWGSDCVMNVAAHFLY